MGRLDGGRGHTPEAGGHPGRGHRHGRTTCEREERPESLTGEQWTRRNRRGRPLPRHASPPGPHGEDFHLSHKDPPLVAYTPNQLSDGETSVPQRVVLPPHPTTLQEASLSQLYILSPQSKFPCIPPILQLRLCWSSCTSKAKGKLQEGGLWGLLLGMTS